MDMRKPNIEHAVLSQKMHMARNDAMNFQSISQRLSNFISRNLVMQEGG